MPPIPEPSRHRPELLAPAGNETCLTAAIQGGCDAVYLGLGTLNMRATAENFSVSDLGRVAETCHAQGVSVYVTANTILYTAETPSARTLIEACRGVVDAVICWDPALIGICRELGVPFHVSTQASVANVEAARFYKQLGAERIIPARECTLEDITRIRNEADIPVEVFAHGAMCVSVSGRCFLSQFTYGHSGNRGRCYQNCRREFHIVSDDGDAELAVGSNYVLSAKDLCTLPFVDRLLDAGVDALKLEGRNRNPEYVRTVVGAYRRAIDAWDNGQLTEDLKTQLVEETRTVYNRDFSAGFFLGRPIAEFASVNGSAATVRKQHVGVVRDYYRKAGAVEMKVQNYIFGQGDTLMIQGPTTGVVTFTAEEIRQNDVRVDTVTRGIATVGLQSLVRENDKVFRLEGNAPPEDHVETGD
ncbi:MAG: U32 family peptidase [Lentisphaerae bacterium]|jgi:U32 family peptidase|nr:U32 family peptidase [Lentisphaerota bacterium]MBT4815104.1 U32 family peptidase [Lentisphaerota bacterium]MBT5611559.1 U32 family peptidase [Lentisphaerota bacterium]MBT7059586.1 U32 family peptidase [Lentisphaerota bacterium]MBT7844986.1 U32 family peptidase [Lentisphaerota bacterium]